MSINNLKEFRQQYPEYNDVSDENVMRTLHAEYYSDFPYEDFDKVFRGQEEQSILRQVADVPLGIASGAVSGVRGITDVFGAQNVLSSALGDVQEYIDSLKSAQSRQDQEEINRILSEAEDKGILDQVKAGFQAFAVAPIDFVSQAAGTALPVIAGGALGAATRLGRAGTQAALGAGMGAGFIKGGIYDTVKNELIESGLSEEQADVAAMEAQSYGGENLDSILLAGIIGGVAGSTGLEKVAANRIMGKLAAKEGAQGAAARAAQTAVIESGTEMVQAGQEQFAQNLALKREGFDVPLSRGVYSAAIMEGLAGGILGGGAGAITPVQREGLSEEAAREREAQLRQREERDRVKFLTALNAKAMEAENNATIVKQLDEAIDAEQDPEVRAGLIEERDIYAQFAETGEPKVPPVTPAVIPPPQEPIEDVVEFGRRYAANISDTLGDAFPSTGKFTIQQSSVVDTNAGPVDTSSIEAQLTSEQLRNARPVFSVVDPDGNRYGVPLDRPDQANALAGALNEEVFNTGIRGEIENILDNAEQAYTPEVADTLFTYGWRVLNPTNSGFSFIDVNRAAGTTADKGYLEGLSFRDVEAGTKKRDGSVDIELPDGRVVNTTGLTVGQKINKKRVENGLPETQVFTVQEVRDELGEGFEGLQISGVQPAPGDSKAQIKRLLEEKNIVTDLAAPEFETLVRSFTGRSKFKDLTKGEANVLYQRLSALPRFDEKTKLPDFTPKPYTRTQFKQASKLIQDYNIRGLKVSDQDLALETGIPYADPRFKEKFSALKKDLGKQGVEPKPILALPAPTGDSINDLRDAIERELRGFGLEGIGLNLNQTLMLPDGQAAQQDTEGFFSPFQRLIFLAVDRVDPKGELTPEQRLSALSEIMNHEVVHAARMLDLWTQSEWSNLENASARLIKPGTNKTYLQVAKESYPDYTPAMVVEEAVAELAREYSKNRKVVSGRPQSLLNRLFKLFEKLKSAIKGTGFQTYEEVLESFQRGDIGRRARGEIRTLRASEAESTAVPERLRPLMGTTPRAPRPRPAAGATRPTTETPRPTEGLQTSSDFDVSQLSEAGIVESRRSKPPPSKTVKGYKLFRVNKNRPGELFPLFVDANNSVPINEWIDAEIGPMAAGKVKSKIGPLAFRPGWHGGDFPIATHIGGKSKAGLKAPDFRPDNQVWAEVEFAADRDWQAEANKRAKRNARGEIISSTAQITDQVPEDGLYRYKTNPNMTGNWIISGSMKVNRLLSDNEIDQINSKEGVSDLPRKQSFDFEAYGFETPSIRESRRNPQVDTPEFKKWFGDSKIVDENGDPLVVYHGTNVDFDYFKIGREGGALGNGIYLGADPDFVANYANQEGGRLIPVYASIKNPLITRTVSGQLSDPMVDALIQLGVTEDKAYSITEKAYDKKGYITTEVQKRAVEKGFDGIVQYKNGKLSEIVAFSPRQIKSAISNVGSFDPYSKFIRESRRSPNELPTPYQRKPVKTPSKATAKDVEMANEYKDRTNFDPYLSDGQITAPIANLRFSVKAPYQEKDLAKGKENHPILGLPLNKNGTVTLYYPATNEAARKVNQDKRLKGATPTSNRIYLTNESSGPKVMQNPGNIDQPMDGANVLIQVDPSLLHLDQEYEDGRKDFFIQLAEGDAYAKKMKMTKLFTLDAPRTRALSQNTKLVDIERSITNSIANYLSLNQKDRRAALKRAKDILKKEHNVGTLMGENGKLQKTRVGDYGLTYDGKSVASMGLGLASAQRINEQNLSTCPKSAICEGLCLGETSGQNLLYGGEGQFKSGPRLSQYLKTEAIVQHPEEFAIALYEEISKFRRWSLSESGVEQVENEAGEKVTQPKQVYQPAIRLNVTSDFRPQTFASIINAFPDVMFYDYTKLPTKSIAPNHHLTYSSTGASQYVNGETVINPESNWDKMVERLNAGNNVAMAFTSRTDMPEFVVDEKTGQRFQVWDGDNYDARFLDPKREDGIGMIIGLTNKDKTTKPEEAAKKYKGFFLNYDKARDGDTLVIPNQRGMSIGPVEPPVIRESRNPALLEQAREKAVQEAEQVPVGAVPYLNANASPEALYVAQNPVAGEPLTPDMRLRYSRSNQPDYDPEDRELIEKMTGTDQPPNKTAGETYMESLTTKQKIRYVWDSIRKEVFFNYSRLEYLVKTDPRLIGNLGDVSSLAAVEFQDRAFALAAEAYARGVPVYQGGITKIVDFNFNGKKYQGLLGVMDPIFNNQYGNLEKAAQSYAVAKRSLRLIREGKQAPGFDKSKTLEENIKNAEENFRKAEEMADKFVNPETGESIIREWNDVWAAYNENIIKYLRDTGILDNETAELWRNQADYVPFYRVEKDGTINAHPKVFGGLTSTTQLKAVGRSSEEITGNMLESITTNLGAAIAMGMKNVAQQRIVRDMITVELGRMLSKGESTKDKMVVTFKVQGKKYQAEIFDPLIFESMQAIPNLDWIDGVMGSILTAPAQFLRQMIVRDPAYMVANTIRDTVANSVTSGSNYIPVVDTFRNLNSGFENLRKYGIVAGIDFSKDPKSLIENMAEEAARRGMRLPDEYTGRLSKMKRSPYVKPLLLAWDFLGDVSAKSEAATRNAVYEDVIARTGNEGEAAYQAMSVINYGRRGRNKAIQFITATVPFFNARLQGLDIIGRSARGFYSARSERSRRRNMISFAARALTMTALTGIYYTLVSDDEEYQSQTEDIKDNYYILPVIKGDLEKGERGFAFKVPIPFEVGVLFKLVPERILRAYNEETDQRALKQSLTKATFNTLGLNPIPQAIKPLIEIATNYDFYTGQPIVPTYMEMHMDPMYRSRFGTNQVAKILGEKIQVISPLKIDHLLNGYTGTLGMYTLQVIDELLREGSTEYPARRPTEYPFVRRFLADNYGKGLQDQFYDMSDKILEATGSINQLIKDGRIDELQAHMTRRASLIALKDANQSIRNMMQDYREQRTMILTSEMDEDTKRQMIDELDRHIALALRIVPELRQRAFGPDKD